MDQPWRIMAICLRAWANGVLISESWYKVAHYPSLLFSLALGP